MPEQSKRKGQNKRGLFGCIILDTAEKAFPPWPNGVDWMPVETRYLCIYFASDMPLISAPLGTAELLLLISFL